MLPRQYRRSHPSKLAQVASLAEMQVSLLTYLNLYSVACGTAELCGGVCPVREPQMVAMDKTVLLTGGVGFIGADSFDLFKIAVPHPPTMPPQLNQRSPADHRQSHGTEPA